MKEELKINFFKKVWYSITKFEQYPIMATEGFKRALKYLIGITAIVTIFVMIGSTMQMKMLVEDFSKYLQEDIPEFSYSNGNLNMQIEDTMIIESIEYIAIDKIVINTLIESEEGKEQLEKDNLIGTTAFFYKDEIVLGVEAENNEVEKQSYTYSDFIASYTDENVEEFDKQQIIEYLRSEKMLGFYIYYGASIFISVLIVSVIAALLNAIEIAILGWITATIARIRIKFSAMYNMAIYSLTLPMFLNILYIIINYFTDFTITYFQVAYITIAYIYLAATIFILKDDIIRKMQEVAKIKEEQLKVREEIREEQEKEQEKEENKEEDKKDENKGEEPQGSEA